MSLIQVRNVPEDIHRRLKERAAREGVTLSDLALAELRRSLDRPTRRELLDRPRHSPHVNIEVRRPPSPPELSGVHSDRA